MVEILSREIHLRRRPAGMPVEDDFALATVPIPELRPGEVLVRNIYMSVDPYMRGRMNAGKSYTPPFQIGEPLTGGAVGQVVAALNGRFQVGDYVTSMLGWREYFVSDGRGLTRIDPRVAPIQAYLGVLGMPGLTAYVGLLDIGRLQDGETVFVSAAAGAVGAVACQIAKIKGCRVIGSAGSPAKVAWLLDEAGVDAAFNYREVADLAAELGRHCPQGIDVYFENVGGAHLEAALQHMNTSGRIADVRHDLPVQRDRAGAWPAQPGVGDREALDAPGVHRLRPRRPAAAVLRRHGAVARGRPDQVAGDGGRRARARPPGVDRPVQR